MDQIKTSPLHRFCEYILSYTLHSVFVNTNPCNLVFQVKSVLSKNVLVIKEAPQKYTFYGN